MGQVKLKDNVDEMLTKISAKRKLAGELVNQKQSIVEQLRSRPKRDALSILAVSPGRCHG